MSAPYIYSGPPGCGFEPGTTYDLTYPPAADGWEPVARSSFAPPAAQKPATVVSEPEPIESSKETS